MSALVVDFERQCELVGLPRPVAEYRFAPPRRWRLDWAWPSYTLALEIEGGVWIGGRHTRGAGFLADLEKYNTAALLGWTVLRSTPQGVKSGEALSWVERVIRSKAN